MAPFARIQCSAALVSRPPENAMPTFSPAGRCWRILAIVKTRPYIISVLTPALVSVLTPALVAALSGAAATQSRGVEQTSPGTRPGAELVDSFDGLGAGL